MHFLGTYVSNVNYVSAHDMRLVEPSSVPPPAVVGAVGGVRLRQPTSAPPPELQVQIVQSIAKTWVLASDVAATIPSSLLRRPAFSSFSSPRHQNFLQYFSRSSRCVFALASCFTSATPRLSTREHVPHSSTTAAEQAFRPCAHDSTTR